MPELEDLLRPLVDRPALDPPPTAGLRARARRRAHRRLAITSITLVLLLVVPIAVIVAMSGDGGQRVGTVGGANAPGHTGSPTTTPAPGPAFPTLPRGFDPRSAFALPGATGPSPVDAAQAYFADRWGTDGDDAAITVLVPRPATIDGQIATLPWTAQVRGGTGEGPWTGSLVLRNEGTATDPQWVVLASAIDGIDLSDLVNADHAASGIVRSSSDQSVVVDITDLQGTPVPRSPYPDAEPNAAGERIGTAGRLAGPPPAQLELDVPLPADASPIVKVQLVGGTVLGVAEVILDPAGAGVDRLPSGAPPGAVTTTAVGGATTGSPTRTTEGPSGSVPETRQPPPWASAPLTATEAPANAAAFARKDAPGPQCPALAPADLGAGAGATARSTERGAPGAWWVAYDLPGAPGEAEIQTPSPAAGKETFSVSAITWPGPLPGAAGSALTDAVDRLPNKVAWADGSHGSYGVEGGRVPTAPTGMDPAWLAYLQVGDSPCMYQVHTYLGRAHLEHLIDQLRYVEGSP